MPVIQPEFNDPRLDALLNALAPDSLLADIRRTQTKIRWQTAGVVVCFSIAGALAVKSLMNLKPPVYPG